MKIIRISVGAAVVALGLLFGVILLWHGFRKYANEKHHGFSLARMLVEGWRRPPDQIPALEWIVSGLVSVGAAALTYYIVFTR